MRPVVALSSCLATAAGSAAECAFQLEDGNDPLRLELPPAEVDGYELGAKAAAALGGLYLASELESAAVVPVAEALSQQRFSLDLRDEGAAAAIERFAAQSRRWLPAADRARLFERLFGTHYSPAAEQGSARTATNNQFEELIAGYCSALLAVADSRPTLLRPQAAMGQARERLRRNLAPRQFGNTLLVAGTIVDQLRAALDLLSMPGVGSLFGTSGVWTVVQAALGAESPDLGRHVGRGKNGQIVLTSLGGSDAPASVDQTLSGAAFGWLVATGFDQDPASWKPRFGAGGR